MNILERFSISREVVFKEGEIKLDQQRVIMFPANFIGAYSIKAMSNRKQASLLYKAMKDGQINFSKLIGLAYSFNDKNFLDRWVKYCEFAGWGVVTYKLIGEKGKYGTLQIKNLPMHAYLKTNGIKDPSDVIFEGLIAGSLSGTFRTNVDVIETDCICAGNNVCVYYWGSNEKLKKNFPKMMKRHEGF